MISLGYGGIDLISPVAKFIRGLKHGRWDVRFRTDLIDCRGRPASGMLWL